MGLMYLTVIGYMAILLFVGIVFMDILTKALHSEDASRIDPKPDTNY